jgi:hypothetical protein
MESLKSKSKTNGHSELIADAFGSNYDGMTIDEIQSMGVEMGVDWSSTQIQDTITRRENTARKNAPGAAPWGAVGLQSLIMWVGDIVLLSVMAVVQKVLLPVSVVSLSYVEYERVKSGAQIVDPANAGKISFVIIMFALGLLFVRAGDASENIKNAYRATVGTIVVLGTAGPVAANSKWHVIVLGTMITIAFYAGLEFVVAHNYANYKQLTGDARFLSGTSSDEHSTTIPGGTGEKSIATARKPSEWARLYFDENPGMLARAGIDTRYEDLVPVISEYAGIHVPKTTIYRVAQRAHEK